MKKNYNRYLYQIKTKHYILNAIYIKYGIKLAKNRVFVNILKKKITVFIEDNIGLIACPAHL